MIRHGSEGYLVDPFDDDSAIYYMNELFQDTSLRRAIGARGRTRFEECFDLNIMVDQYRRLIYEVAPPTVLVDMDGVIVDWDTGFRAAWNSRSAIDRSKSYYMENCVEEYHREAELLYHTKGFFENLPPVDGAVRALQDMQDEGLRVLICSTPVLTSLYCAQEKINWVRQYLGESWLDKLILCADKAQVRGDILIDDKPLDVLAPMGKHTAATWKQIIFDAHYNQSSTLPRLTHWRDWKKVIRPLLGKKTAEDPYHMEYGAPSPSLVGALRLQFPLEEGVHTADELTSIDVMLTNAYRSIALEPPDSDDGFDQLEDGVSRGQGGVGPSDSMNARDGPSLSNTDDVKKKKTLIKRVPPALSDASGTFIEEYRSLKLEAEKEAGRTADGLPGLTRNLNRLALEMRSRVDAKERRVAMHLGDAEDALDLEFFRKSYRKWRKESCPPSPPLHAESDALVNPEKPE
eukprot:gene1937-2288_t